MTGKKPGKIEQNVNIPWVYLDKGKAGGYIISKVITDYLKENETPSIYGGNVAWYLKQLQNW